MPISGTIPFFDLSTAPEPTLSLVVVTGAQADGQANGTTSPEIFQSFLQRVVNALALSGVLSASGDVSGMQCFSGAVLSGVMNIQRECAMRLADIERLGSPNGPRLQFARDSLAVNGEFQFGS